MVSKKTESALKSAIYIFLLTVSTQCATHSGEYSTDWMVRTTAGAMVAAVTQFGLISGIGSVVKAAASKESTTAKIKAKVDALCQFVAQPFSCEPS